MSLSANEKFAKHLAVLIRDCRNHAVTLLDPQQKQDLLEYLLPIMRDLPEDIQDE